MAELETLGTTVAGLLKSRGETVAVAESSTGGLISAALLAAEQLAMYDVAMVAGHSVGELGAAALPTPADADADR